VGVVHVPPSIPRRRPPLYVPIALRLCGIGKRRDGGILRPVLPLDRDGDGRGRDRASGTSILLGSPPATRLLEIEALAARIAGDLANLLAPVLGGVTLLAEELPRGHPLRGRVENIQQAAAAARAFAQRVALLDPKRKLSFHRTDIGALSREWLPWLRGRLRRDIALDVVSADDIDIVRVDRQQLEHAIVELALNAQDSMPAGGSVHIDVAMVAGEGGADKLPLGSWVRVRVRDSGCGMEAALIEHACEPFVSTKVPGVGAGLGLPIVVAIVRQHGGLLALESRLGFGTTASLFLPCHVTGTRSRECTPPAGTAVALEGVPVPGTTVLVVEDNAMVRRSIEVTLRAAGYQVTSVDSGEHCIEAMSRLEEPLHLLITDVVMPEMSGEEMITRVRELRPDLPVLIISGYDRATLARRHRPAATEHFLQKPFDSDDLFAAVRKALSTRSGQRGE
jgi:signal transduction histidine kinase/ActR/RegA family two-component response regulator